MVEKTKHTPAKPLRIVDPKLYQYIVKEFNDRHNIHAYDVEVIAIREVSGLHITLRYGEGYVKSKEAFFTCQTIKEFGETLQTFIHEAADDCKKVMVANYFKMMKP